MSLKSVYFKLEKLNETDSTNDKVELLKDYLEDRLFRKVVWCACTDTLQFHVKKFPEYSRRTHGLIRQEGKKYIFPILKKLSKQNGATDFDKNKLFDAASIDKETFEVVRRICTKDLRCGVSYKLVNKARPGTIKNMPYQRCKTSKHIHNIVFEPEAIIQTKADGAFVNVFIDGFGEITFRTRSGQLVRQLGFLKKKMKEQPPAQLHGGKRGVTNKEDLWDKVYLGELRVWEIVGKKIMSRKKGNGIINQCIQGTANTEDAKKVFFTVWDCIPIDKFWEEKDETAYNTRFFYANCLTNAVANDKYVRTIETRRVTSLDEAYAFYKEQRLKGEEGAILKNLKAIWRDQQSGSPDMIKLKHVFEVDLKVVKWVYGEKGKKNEHRLGALIYISSCGKLTGRVGSGFTDEEREGDLDRYNDAIIAVEAESVIKSKTKSTYSLYTPSFIEIRKDKHVADSLERVLEIEKESKRNKRKK